jgi:hypothetical protein
MATTNPLYPLNDFIRTLLLETVDPATGVTSPVDAGTVTGFLATSNNPTATAAHATLEVTGTYIGGANGFEDGTWLFEIDAVDLTATLLDTLFGDVTPYFIVQMVGGVRVYEKLKYVAARPAALV